MSDEIRAVPPRCPFCLQTECVLRDGDEYGCTICGKTWKAWSEEDKAFLRVQKIEPE